ncbi:MAG: MraY family glycosyltransferase [bacterium]
MFNYTYISAAFVVSFLTAILFTPPAARLARKLGAVDRPGARRVNVTTVPRLGGPAMFLAFLLSSLPYLHTVNHGATMLAGGFLFLALGTLDDLFDLRASVKLAAQILIALITYYSGIRVAYITNPLNAGELIALHPYVSFAITMLWIVGVTNTLNLIDGLDGLAAGVTCIASVTLFLVAIEKGQPGSACVAASMAGLSAGFIRWNFYKAKIFMGDSGAYFLGYMLAVIAIQGAFKSTVGLTYLIPVFVLGVPIFDTWFAIARRLKSRRPVMSQPDKGHLHHRMLSAGIGHRETVLLFYAMTLFLGVFSLLLIRAWLLALYLIGAMAAIVTILLASGKIFKRKTSEKA